MVQHGLNLRAVGSLLNLNANAGLGMRNNRQGRQRPGPGSGGAGSGGGTGDGIGPGAGGGKPYGHLSDFLTAVSSLQASSYVNANQVFGQFERMWEGTELAGDITAGGRKKKMGAGPVGPPPVKPLPTEDTAHLFSGVGSGGGASGGDGVGLGINLQSILGDAATTEIIPSAIQPQVFSSDFASILGMDTGNGGYSGLANVDVKDLANVLAVVCGHGPGSSGGAGSHAAGDAIGGSAAAVRQRRKIVNRAARMKTMIEMIRNKVTSAPEIEAAISRIAQYESMKAKLDIDEFGNVSLRAIGSDAPTSKGRGKGHGSGPGAGRGAGQGSGAVVPKVEAKVVAKPPEPKKPVLKLAGKKPPAPGGTGKKAPPPKKKSAEAGGAKATGPRLKKFPWEPIDDAEAIKNTEFDEIRAIAVPITKEKVVDDFSIVTKTAEDDEPKKKAKEIIKLFTDAKRHYTMSIATARIVKMGYDNLKTAVETLDPEKIDPDTCRTIIEFAPKPEELAAVKAYIENGGIITDCDRPEQYVHALLDVKSLVPKLEAHAFAQNFAEEFDELAVPAEKFINGVTSLRNCKKLANFLFIVMRIGNIVNESDVHGLRLSSIPKLNDYKTSSKPVQTLIQYIVKLSLNTPAEADLLMVDDIKPCLDGSKVDLAGLESRITAFTNSLRKVKASVEKLANEGCQAVIDRLVPFMAAAETQMESMKRMLEEAKDSFQEFAFKYGETPETLASVSSTVYLGYCVKLARELAAQLKDAKEKAMREAKRNAALKKEAAPAAPTAPTAPAAPGMRGTEDVSLSSITT